MGDFCTKSSIVHEKNIQILGVMHKEFLETIGKMVSGLFIRTVADFGHGPIASEASSHSVIDTMSSSPAGSEPAPIEV